MQFRMSKSESLRRSTSMLYVFTLASYLFALVTLPYQTRVLGPALFGQVSLALAIAAVFGVVFDFGFLLSGTARVTLLRSSHADLANFYSSVVYAKLVLIALGACAMSLLIAWLPSLSADPLLFWLSFASSAAVSLMPDFFYRGLERMTPLAVRSVIAQGLSTLLVFALVRSSRDYLLVPLASLVPNVLALVFVHAHIARVFGTSLRTVTPRSVFMALRDSAPYFVSRFAGRLASSANVVVLGWVYPVGAPTVGVYAAVDRLISAANRASSPLADSLHPYMLRTADYGRLGRIIIYISVPLALVGAIAWFLSDWVALALLGEQYVSGGALIRILLLLVVSMPASYLLGFPALAPSGASRAANHSAIAGSLVHLALVVALFLTSSLDAVSACYALVGGQIVVVVSRLVLLRARGVRLFANLRP